jgi:hypothetical protein
VLGVFDAAVHHLNGDKTDNRPENLGVLPHGEHSRLHRSKIDAFTVIQLYRAGWTGERIGRQIGHSPSSVMRILKKWREPLRSASEVRALVPPTTRNNKGRYSGVTAATEDWPNADKRADHEVVIVARRITPGGP